MSMALENKNKSVLQFVHITDPHLLNHPQETFHGLNTKNSLESVLSEIKSRFTNVDFILITGDISQTGDKKSYAVLKSVIEKYDSPIYCIPGNHDTPEYLHQVVTSSPNDSINIIQYGKFSLVLLNSCIENQHHGTLSVHSMQQLEKHLRNNKNQFNIIAIHHPPVLVNSKWLDELGLVNKAEFISLVQKYTKQTLILFGHVHQQIDQSINGLRFISTPSTCYQFKTESKTMQRLDHPPPTYRLFKLNLNNPTNIVQTKVYFVV